jgi:hypothetical protein
MRDTYPDRVVYLRGEDQLQTAFSILRNAPLDPESPLAFMLGEEKKKRTAPQNARMWAGCLKDISEQVFVQRRRHDDVVWHEYLKERYLPEDEDPDIAKLAKEGYRKWVHLPNSKRRMIGSTTDLTTTGFARYLDEVYAWGCDHGVQFSEKSMTQLYEVREKAK